MKNRKRNNMVIGLLCAMLVFMGIGYALISTVLSIGATANIKGDFDIHFLTEDDEYTENGVQKRGITLIDYENSTSSNTVYKTTVPTFAATMESSTGVDTQDPTKASFSAVLQKPTDYATFTAIAKNYGTIKGKISTVTITSTPSQELSDWLSVNGGTYSDYFEVTTTAQQNTVLNPGGEYDFSVTVRFKESATKLPQGSLENEIVITYVQATEGQSTDPVQPSTEDDKWIVNQNGLVISYPSSAIQNGVLTVPATTLPNGQGEQIKSIDKNSFIPKHNVIIYYTSDGLYAMITDQTNYEKLNAYASKADIPVITDVSQIPQNVEIQDTQYFNLDTTILVEEFNDDNLEPAVNEFSVIDLTSATNLTAILDHAFYLQDVEEIRFNNSLETIGAYAFCGTPVKNIVIPSSLKTIGDRAFSKAAVESVDFSNSTSLISMGYQAFYDNYITNVNLGNATSLKTIGEASFDNNRIQTITLPSSISSIGDEAFQDQFIPDDSAQHLATINIPFEKENFLNTVTLGNDWYDSDNTGLKIIYNDYTCDNLNSNCALN